MSATKGISIGYAEQGVKPFGIKDKMGYLFGDFGNDFMFIFANMFFMIFCEKKTTKNLIVR